MKSLKSVSEDPSVSTPLVCHDHNNEPINRLARYCGEIDITVMAEEADNETVEKSSMFTKPTISRTVIGFWLLGLCNNYGYVVMLTAAHDILSDDTPTNNQTGNGRHCNDLSTGAILLADVVPSLVIKAIAPFFPLVIHFRMVLVLILAATGFILVAEANNHWVAIAGVVSTALSSGLGEASLLSYMAFYKDKNVISTWSSGTGGAGFFGSFTYTLLTAIMSRYWTLYSLLTVPVVMGLSFWCLLGKPDIQLQSVISEDFDSKATSITQSQNEDINNYCDATPLTSTTESILSKLKILPSLLKFMIPMMLVYFFEYLINQGLFELVQFDITWPSYKAQYKWYQVDYQIGVFLSRSSINFLKIKKLWILAVLQGLNVIIFATEAVYSYIPYIHIILVAVFWEGLLGGATYVNTYHRISTEVPVEKQEFSMAFTSLSDAIGITLAGFLAIPVHNYICSLPK